MYDELIKSLRVCGDSNNSCGNCPIRENDGSCPHGEWEFAAEKYMLQAADAIEELSQIAAHHEQKAKDYWQEACEYREQIAHLVKEQAALFEPALKSLGLSKRPYVLEAPQPRWIPVTERLPKELERVLVACEDGVSFGFFEEIIADDEFVKEWHDMMYYPISVTHWMPLPKSPKEG